MLHSVRLRPHLAAMSATVRPLWGLRSSATRCGPPARLQASPYELRWRTARRRDTETRSSFATVFIGALCFCARYSSTRARASAMRSGVHSTATPSRCVEDGVASSRRRAGPPLLGNGSTSGTGAGAAGGRSIHQSMSSRSSASSEVKCWPFHHAEVHSNRLHKYTGDPAPGN